MQDLFKTSGSALLPTVNKVCCFCSRLRCFLSFCFFGDFKVFKFIVFSKLFHAEVSRFFVFFVLFFFGLNFGEKL